MALEVDGSNPFIHPTIKNKSFRTLYGGIAQLARASGSYPAGRWFKSDFRYHKIALANASAILYEETFCHSVVKDGIEIKREKKK